MSLLTVAERAPVPLKAKRGALRGLSERHVDLMNNSGHIGLHLHVPALALHGKFPQHTAEQTSCSIAASKIVCHHIARL